MMMYCFVILLSFAFFIPNVINGSVVGTAVTLSLFLALIMLPNSLFIKIIRVRVDEPITPGQNDNSIDPNFKIDVEFKNQPRPKFQYKQRKIGAILLLAISFIVGIVSIVGAFFMGKRIVDNKDSNRLVGILGTFFGSVIFGYIYGILKLLVGAYVAMNAEKQRGWIKFLFLDVLTKEAADHLMKQKSTRKVFHQNVSENDEDMHNSQSSSRHPLRSKKKKKKKKKND